MDYPKKKKDNLHQGLRLGRSPRAQNGRSDRLGGKESNREGVFYTDPCGRRVFKTIEHQSTRLLLSVKLVAHCVLDLRASISPSLINPAYISGEAF